MAHGFGINIDYMKAEELAEKLKKLNYHAVTLGSKVIAFHNRETIIVEIADDAYTIKIGSTDGDILRKKTVKRKQFKSVMSQIVSGFDEAEELRNHYTKQWLESEALFYDAKWLSATYFEKSSV